jgi:hypothetical protein
VVGLDGGYVRSRHRQDERHFEVIAGKVFDADGNQSRFAFARNGPATAFDAFKQALVVVMLGCGGCSARRCRSDGRSGLVACSRAL